MFYIYGLHLEGDEEIRYVGSSCDPKTRLRQHLGGYDGRNPEKDEWVASNRDRLRMKILQSNVSESDRRREEQRAILECAGKGHRLFNARRVLSPPSEPSLPMWTIPGCAAMSSEWPLAASERRTSVLSGAIPRAARSALIRAIISVSCSFIAIFEIGDIQY